MADGPTDPEPGDGGRPEEGKVLSPEELDISRSEHVEQIDEDRFVVSPSARVDSTPREPRQEGTPDGDPRAEPAREPSPEPARESSPEPAREPSPEPGREGPAEPTGDRGGTAGPEPTTGSRGQPTAGDLTRDQVHAWLRESFEGNSSRYGFDVTATFDGSVGQRRMASNDVVTIFESLVLWYAQQVDSDTPVEEILGILLMEANVPVRYPPESLKSLVKSAGLGPEDTIADLLARVDEDDGLKL
jgi:hypothetical protein